MRILIASCLLLIALPAMASTTITYQGQLQDSGGPVDDTVMMEFLLYADETAMTLLAADDPRWVTVNEGLFQTELDFGQQAWGDGLWLEIVIDGGDPLAPRQRLTAAPLALGVAAGSISNAAIADGAIGSAQIDSAEVQARVDGVCAIGSAIGAVNPNGTVSCQPMPDDYWRQGGNAVDGSQFLGTINSEPLVLRTAGVDSLRIEPSDETFNGFPVTVNIIAGSEANSVADGVRGATIAGGGVPEGYFEPGLITGKPNRVSSHYGSIGGGFQNRAGDQVSVTDGSFATVGGGVRNIASKFGSTVGGGAENTSTELYSTVGGGRFNIASDVGSTVSGGGFNSASGRDATVPGGVGNEAAGDYSFAAGRKAHASDDGTFVWADSGDSDFVSSGPDQFLIRAGGGVGINTNSPARMLHMKGSASQTPTMLFESENAPDDQRIAAFFMNQSTGHMSIGRMTDSGASLVTTHFQIRADDGYVGIGRTGGNISHPLHMASGAHVTAGGSWTNSSDVDAKSDFQPVDPELILASVMEMPINYWQYRDEPGVRHVGPTAQDFHASFSLGGSDTSISTVDSDGVALAAIQGLHAKLAQERQRTDLMEARQSALEAENNELKRQLAEQREATAERLAALETMLLEDRRVAEVQ